MACWAAFALAVALGVWSAWVAGRQAGWLCLPGWLAPADWLALALVLAVALVLSGWLPG